MPTELTSTEALQRLMDGNRRWTQEIPHRPNQTVHHRLHVARNGQRPFAIAIGCSDSRVPAEIVFDVGLGDLFMIRTAGHLVGDLEIGSIEYGVLHLGIPLVVILGHEQCGAVTAATSGQAAPGFIDCIVRAIKPAVTIAQELAGDIVTNAVMANVALVTQQIMTASTVVRERVEADKLMIVGGYYHLEEGRVDIIPIEQQIKILATP